MKVNIYHLLNQDKGFNLTLSIVMITLIRSGLCLGV